MEKAGTVTIGSFASVIQPIVIPALKTLARQRPHLQVAVTELEAPAAFAALDRGAIDVLISVDYVAGPTHGNPHYDRVDLVHDPLVVVFPNDHRLASSTRPLRLRELAGERWVMGTVGHPCVDITVAAQSAAGFTADVVHRTDDWAATAAIVACGEAIALIPKLALMSIPRRGFTTRELAQRTARSIYAATRSGSTHAPHVATVLSALGSAAESCL